MLTTVACSGGDDAGIDAGDAGIDAGDAGIDAGDAGIDAGDAGIDAGDAGIDAGDAGIDAGDAGIDAGDAGIDAGDAGIDAGDAGIDAGDAGIDAGDAGIDAGDAGIDAGDAGIDAGDAGIDACQLALGISCAEFEEAYIKASNTEVRDAFGNDVSLDGDTLAVAGLLEDSATTGVNGEQSDNSLRDSGAVYVFTRNNGVWSQQAYIKASNTDAGDSFGISVSLDGDTLAVGTTDEGSVATGVNGEQGDNLASDSGAVYVFTRNNGIWSQQAYIKASNTDAGDSFGVSVSLDGDTLAVGAQGEDSATTGVNGAQGDNSASDSGAVYVFTRNNGVWGQQAYIKASNAEGGDAFGISVSLDGDTLAVGAASEDSATTGAQGDNSASDSGAVYVFTRNNGVWSQQAYIKASNAEGGDAFGFSISLFGDTLAVGGHLEDSAATGVNGEQGDNSAFRSGAVYVFTRNNGVWSQQAYIKASNTDAIDFFGVSVSLDGDTLAVGGGSGR